MKTDITEEDWTEFREYVQHLELRLKHLERKVIPDLYHVMQKMADTMEKMARRDNDSNHKWWEKEW